MSKDHAIMLLGEAIHIMENWTAHTHPLGYTLDLVRMAKGDLETAPAQVVTGHAGASFTGSLSHSVQVTDAMVCRFLDHLRDLAGHGYVTSGGGMDRVYVIDGVWSTEELRAAILAALGEK